MGRHNELGLPRHRSEIQIWQKEYVRSAEQPIQLRETQIPKREIEKLIGKTKHFQGDIGIFGRPTEIQACLSPGIEKEHILILHITQKKPLQKCQSILFHSSALSLHETPYIDPYAHKYRNLQPTTKNKGQSGVSTRKS